MSQPKYEQDRSEEFHRDLIRTYKTTYGSDPGDYARVYLREISEIGVMSVEAVRVAIVSARFLDLIRYGYPSYTKPKKIHTHIRKVSAFDS